MKADPLLSIIIPTLNEALFIESTLNTIKSSPGNIETIIVDAHSTDDTVAIARKFQNIKIVQTAKKGRAHQMNRGAKIAGGDYLFFLHADTLPPLNFYQNIRNVLIDPKTIGGSFCIRFDHSGWHYRFLSTFSRLNFSFTTYGDQGLFLRKSTFAMIDGFPRIPILEDLEVQHRLRKRGEFRKILLPIITSGRRFQRNGFLKQIWIDIKILAGYYLGISAERLNKWYK